MIKALCFIQECSMDPDGNLILMLSIQTPNGGDGSVRFGPVRPELITLNEASAL